MPESVPDSVLAGVLSDLRAEGDELAALVGPLHEHAWTAATPAPGWSVAHQIAHLAWTDRMALLAIQEPNGFTDELQHAQQSVDDYVDRAAADGARQPHTQLFAAWQRGRSELHDALQAMPHGQKIAWFGPPMSPTSMATARLMETWAHAGDVADALGERRTPTARLRHVAHLAVRTRDFAFLLRGEQPPADGFRIELTAPDGELWAWGEPTVAQRVTGPAIDFCRLAVQRVNRADTALVAAGPDADRWLDIVQAFAGPPGEGRPAARSSAASELR